MFGRWCPGVHFIASLHQPLKAVFGAWYTVVCFIASFQQLLKEVLVRVIQMHASLAPYNSG